MLNSIRSLSFYELEIIIKQLKTAKWTVLPIFSYFSATSSKIITDSVQHGKRICTNLQQSSYIILLHCQLTFLWNKTAESILKQNNKKQHVRT